jgi:CBS domain-containing protein
MICPDCGHDNIDGEDLCAACGQPLVEAPVETDLERSITSHSISVLCPNPPVTIDAQTPVREAVRQMVERHIGCVLVEERGELAGIFTERDVLNRVSDDLGGLDRPVAEFMTRSPETIAKHDSIAFALQAMDLGGYRHMPIVDRTGRPTGIISVRDILRFLCVRFAQLRSAAG